MKVTPQKIVFIGPFGLQPKGTMSVRALPLAKALAARGHTVTVLIPPWDDPDRAGQTWIEDGVQVVNVKLARSPAGGLPLLSELLVTARLVRRALAEQPDVIHFFKPKAYAGLAHLAVWALKHVKRLPSRLVVDADDWEQAWNEVIPYPEWQKWFFAWQEWWGLTYAEAITVASTTLERLVIAQTRGEQPDIFYLPNGYRPELNGGLHREICQAAVVRAQEELGDAPVVLLYTRFAEFRPERLVSLVARVAEVRPEVRWLVIGRGLDSREARARAELARAGLEEQVRFAGWVPVERLPDYFAAADVAVHVYDDTLINRAKCSVKLIDLLAAGLPVVADAIGQNCEYIRHEQSGILVPPENDAAMAEAVIALLDDAEARQRLGQAAAEHVRAHFNWSSLAEAVERAYC